MEIKPRPETEKIPVDALTRTAVEKLAAVGMREVSPDRRGVVIILTADFDSLEERGRVFVSEPADGIEVGVEATPTNRTRVRLVQVESGAENYALINVYRTKLDQNETIWLPEAGLPYRRRPGQIEPELITANDKTLINIIEATQ